MLREEGRGRQVRRVLRRRPAAAAARRPRHHRQHGARVRRDLRLLPGGRREHARVPAPHRPGAKPDIADWSRPTCKRPRACWIATDDTAGIPMFTDTCWNSTSARCNRALAGPKRPQDRVESAQRPCKPHFRESPLTAPLGLHGHGVDQPTKLKADRGRHRSNLEYEGLQPESWAWRRGHRRDHLLHQHFQSRR